MLVPLTTLLGVDKAPHVGAYIVPIDVVEFVAEYNLLEAIKYAPSSLGYEVTLEELVQIVVNDKSSFIILIALVPPFVPIYLPFLERAPSERVVEYDTLFKNSLKIGYGFIPTEDLTRFVDRPNRLRFEGLYYDCTYSVNKSLFEFFKIFFIP